MQISRASRKPHALIMVGLPYSGKTYFAKRFAETFKAPLISDEIVAEDLSMLSKDLKLISECSKIIAEKQFKEALKSNHTVIYDGDTHLKKDRMMLALIAKTSGYEPMFVWVQADSNTVKKRAVKAKADLPSLENHNKRFIAPNLSERAIVISGHYTFKNQLQVVLGKLSNPV